MGAQLSKSPSGGKQKAPTILSIGRQEDVTPIAGRKNENVEMLDPRSPFICRTPMNTVINSRCPITKSQNLTEVWNVSEPDNNRVLLNNKFLCELKSKPQDPRSPSQFINRTPIVFDAETNSPVYLDAAGNIANDPVSDSMIGVLDESFATEETKSESIEDEIPAAKYDPRSPTVGVERTPIVLKDDDTEAIENIVMEKFSTAVEIQNKAIERVKNPRSRIAKRTISGKEIYQDITPIIGTSKQRLDSISSSTPKRTPLGCVANKSHLRSKSVENSTKSVKNRTPLGSFEDYCVDYLSGESPRSVQIRRLNI